MIKNAHTGLVVVFPFSDYEDLMASLRVFGDECFRLATFQFDTDREFYLKCDSIAKVAVRKSRAVQMLLPLPPAVSVLDPKAKGVK